MSNRLAITVRATPAAQPRAKAARIGAFVRMYTPSTAEAWKSAVKDAVHKITNGRVLFTGPVVIDWTFYLPRPKKLYRKSDPDGPIPHGSKPDFDNLAKSTSDAITDVGAWRDDSQVFDARIRKFYCAKDCGPWARIVIEEAA